MTPRATYRLQFTPEFRFDHAAELAPYLAKLGVSHLYASPYLKARPGSTHGYDIVDHNELNPELGDGAAFDRMNEALRRAGLKQILDFVPNHMGVGGADNPVWLDVLEWGRDSIYAGWFDIDWENDRPYLEDKLLIPFLGGQYGAELAAGKLTLKFDADEGSFAVWAYDSHKLPVSPHHYGEILGADHAELERMGDSFANMASWRPQVTARATRLKLELASLVRADPGIAAALDTSMRRFVGREDEPGSWDALNGLIRRQHWHPAHFIVAGDDINYRRFFNINDLAGLRMEIPEVFDHTHRLVFELMAKGIVDGLRIDHVDGLYDPKGYLERLRGKAEHPDGAHAWYLIVEKILARHERLRRDWPVQGTTGYEMANLLLGLMVDSSAEASFSRSYEDFIGARARYARTLLQCKKQIMDNELASELDRLARSAVRVAHQSTLTEDFTKSVLRRALREIVSCFRVYRTYVDSASAPTADDRAELHAAIEAARPSERAIDPSVYDFLERALIGDLVAKPHSGFSRTAVLRFAMKVQQYSGPVMAKGLEDTAFYRYNRFIGLNEVGGHPDHFGLSLDDFHTANRLRAEEWPAAMLGTSTHDTKRGEDVRARLAALSEFPDEWRELAPRLSRLLRPTVDEGDTPDRNDEYALLQWIVGTWPVELLDRDDADVLKSYAERLKSTMTKAMREAKVHTTWAMPDPRYEAATLALVDAALMGEPSKAFLAALRPFAATLAQHGARNGVVQTVLKLTLPGVPDLYQGAELWDLSMVDPDNRRPVDFELRSRLLHDVGDALGRDRAGAMAGYMERWEDGRIKLATIATLLDLRNRHPALFAEGGYEPVTVRGSSADLICAFRRRGGGKEMLVAATRFPRRATEAGRSSETVLDVEEDGWTDALTGRDVERLDAASLFATLPAAVLLRAR